MKKSFFKNDIIISLIIFIFFMFFSIFLPIYDNLNGFHNLIFDDYKLVWYDGKTPANLYVTKNILEGKSIFFPKNYSIDGVKVENFYDFVEKNGSYFPVYTTLPNYLYAVILNFVPISPEIQLFKSMIFLTMFFSAVTVSIFYLVQRLLGLNAKYSFFSTIIVGIATSVLIYSRYLFIDHTIMSLMFVSLIYSLLINREKKSLKIEILAMIFFSIFIILLWYELVIITFSVVLSYFFIKYNLIRSAKILIIPLVIVSVTLILLYLPYFWFTPKPPVSGITDIIKIWNIPIFSTFSRYVNALDYSVFGYHDLMSVWKLYRGFAYIYAFEEQKGNAIFLSTYGLFGSLFGPRGIIFNSAYLIFSVLGIFIYKKEKERNFLLAIIILIIICYGLLLLRWQGGLSPRYIRYYTIPVMLLTFFSFYYIQETKNILAKLIFLILVVLSVMNVISLAVRADWTYEHEADLVSYDLVLWPWYPQSEGEKMNLLLYSQSEQARWQFDKDQCVYKEPGRGIITDVCECVINSSAFRNIYIPWENIEINISACADNSGKDGTIGYFKFDDYFEKIFIPSNSCQERHLILNNTKGLHDIEIQVKGFGKCGEEWVIWKEIKIKKFIL